MISLQELSNRIEAELINAQAEGLPHEACVEVIQVFAMRYNVYVPITREAADAYLATAQKELEGQIRDRELDAKGDALDRGL